MIPISAYGPDAAASELLPSPVKKAGILRWGTLLVGFEILVTFLLLIIFIDLLHADLITEKGMLERVPAGH